MKKNIIFLILILIIVGGLSYYIYILKLEKKGIELEKIRINSEREQAIKEFSSLVKEKAVLYTSTQVMKNNIESVVQTYKKDHDKFGRDEANFLSQIDSLWREKEDLLKIKSEDEIRFREELLQLQSRFNEAERDKKELADILTKKDKEFTKNSGEIKELKDKKSGLENINLELTGKVRELNGKLDNLQKEKAELSGLVEWLKRSLKEKTEKLEEKEREIAGFETTYDSAILVSLNKKLRKEFDKEREKWGAEKKVYEEKLKKQDDAIKNISLKFEQVEAENKKLREEKVSLETDRLQKGKKIETLENLLKQEKFDYYYTSGLHLFQGKHYKEAIVEFEKAKDLNPKEAKVYYNMGIIYDDYLMDTKKAVENYKKYLELNPNAKDREQIEEWIKGAKNAKKGAKSVDE